MAGWADDKAAALVYSAHVLRTFDGRNIRRKKRIIQFAQSLSCKPPHKVLRSHTQKVANRASQAFRQAAQAVARSDSAIGAYYRAMRARKGPEQATVATAHKIARIVYHLLKYGQAYEAESADAYEQKRQERELRVLTRRAAKLGYTLAPVSEPLSDSSP
jgi:hypothetical protein